MRDFDKFHRYSANIGEMMERMGIEYTQGVAAHFRPSMRVVIQSCQVCRSSNICSEWLAQSPVAVARAPEFCPFADRLDGLLGDGDRPVHTMH